MHCTRHPYDGLLAQIWRLWSASKRRRKQMTPNLTVPLCLPALGVRVRSASAPACERKQALLSLNPVQHNVMPSRTCDDRILTGMLSLSSSSGLGLAAHASFSESRGANAWDQCRRSNSEPPARAVLISERCHSASSHSVTSSG